METNRGPENDTTMQVLLAELDERAAFMSGGFELLPVFQTIVGMRESALPALLSDESQLYWERIQAVCTIANRLGLPIASPEEVFGHHEAVSAIVIDWGRQNGYVADPETRPNGGEN